MTTMTKAEFARHINKKPGYITQLHAAGRLVMDGNKVNVEESIQRIHDTRDPSKQGVADRHAQAREQKQQSSSGPSNKIDIDSSGSAYQRAKAVKEKYVALMAKTNYEREIKQLLPVDEVKQAVMDGDIIIRSRLESLPDILSPQLAAESDERRIRALLIEQIELILSELSRSFHKLIKE